MDFFDGLSFPAAGVIPYGHVRAHTPLYYGIQFNSSGTIQIRVNRKNEYVLSGPSCFITHPGAFFEYKLSQNERHDFTYFCFTGPRVEKYIRSGLLDLNIPPLQVRQEYKFKTTLKDIMFNRLQGNYPETVNLLENLLLMICRGEQSSPLIYQTPVLQELIHNIHFYPEKNWDFESEARKLSITTSHFRRIFHKMIGDSPQHYLLKQRLAKAAELLAHTNEQIQIIASKCGFEDVFYFLHLFKKYYSISPKKYREEKR